MHTHTDITSQHTDKYWKEGRAMGLLCDTRGALRQPWHRTVTIVVMLRPGALRMVLIDGGWGDGGK